MRTRDLEDEAARLFRFRPAPWGEVLWCAVLGGTADHGFTDRALPLGRTDGGDRQSWRRLADAAGVEPDHLVRLRQVHAAECVVVGDETRMGEPSEGDIILTSSRRHAVLVQAADCVPILIADPGTRAVAAVHAGWRGMAARAPLVAVDALAKHFGADPGALVAAVGPSIGPCCYEVGAELREVFEAAGHQPAVLDRWFIRDGNGRVVLDLWLAARSLLEAAGVPPDRIYACGLCTAARNSRFPSYRIEGPAAGRLAAWIRPRA